MSTYIAFLRGINVSGQKIIKMTDLKAMFESIKGFRNVITFIQSGNVIFESAEKDASTLARKIEKQIEKTFHFEVPVFIKTDHEMKELIRYNPFAKREAEHIKTYVTFFEEIPSVEKTSLLMNYSNDVESYHLNERDLFLSVDKSSDQKVWFSNNFVESKLKIKATTRDMNTIRKMVALIEKAKS